MIGRWVAALFALVFLSASANAATQIVNSNGLLTGATGVIVNGQSYTVTLVEGTCASVYGSCATSSFDFTTQAGATAAAQALLDQVYVDTAAGNFNTTGLANIYGCGLSFLCDTSIAYSYSSGTTVSTMTAENTNSTDRILSSTLGVTYDTTPSLAANYARFTLETPVPEPATWALFILGFGLTGKTLRRKTPSRSYKIRN